MFSEDLSEFLNADELATNATIGVSTVAGIFEDQFVEVLGVEGVRPVFTCAASDVPSIAQGDNVTINSISYKVAGVQPDGTGLTSLILEKQ